MATVGELLDLGMQYYRAGNLRGAEQLYGEVVRADPQHAGALHMLGLVAYQSGRYEPAIGYLRRAVSARPDLAEAHGDLGAVLTAKGMLEEAIDCYRQAILFRPDFAEAHYNLGSALRAIGLLTEALTCFEETLRIRPRYGPARNNLGEALVGLGDMTGAEGHFRNALQTEGGFLLGLCNLVRFGFATDDELAHLHGLLSRPGLTPDGAVLIHMTLGEVLDRAGRFDEAFAHFRVGNALHRKELERTGGAYNREQNLRLFHSLVAPFSAAFFEKVQGFGVDSDLPVFIVGMPRSGTTLVEQILASHREVFGAGELRELGHLTRLMPAILGVAEAYPSCMNLVHAAGAHAAAERYLAPLRERAGGARRITDKQPANYMYLGLIATLFPRSRIIHCRRDPMDVCLSCYFQNFRGLNYAWDLHDLGTFHKDYERLMARWRTVLPIPIMEVVYEELVADTEAMSRRLVEFCGLKWDEQCLKFHENRRPVWTPSQLQVRRPIYTSSVGRWRKYDAHLEPLRQALSEPD
jgi:tetratricopeptide (TPR) repeat protein